MPAITSSSPVLNSVERRIAALEAAAQRKLEKNEAAAARARRRLEREFDSNGDALGYLKLAIAHLVDHHLGAPAWRKVDRPNGPSGRSFHGGGEAYSRAKPRNRTPQHRLAKATGTATSHYAYIDEHGRGDRHISYIDAGRVEVTPDGTRLVMSNIEGTFTDRMSLFDAAERCERESGGDCATLDFERMSPALLAVFEHPDCDPAVKEAYRSHLTEPWAAARRIPLEGSCEDLRQLIRKHGVALVSKGKNEWRIKTDGIAFHKGRSGRTHFRWVFELPQEFDSTQRQQVLKLLCAYMKRENFMYAAVIHAPDPHNDPNNHHIHLMFYDRPCRRLTGTSADLKGVKPDKLRFAREALDAKLVKPGTWDFAYVHHYQTGGSKPGAARKSGKSWKTNHPFEANKPRNGLTSHRDYKKKLRADYSVIVNGVARRSGVAKLFDPRSYEARKLAGFKPSKKLGTKLFQAEIAGLPTPIGQDNEAGQSAAARWRIQERHAVEAARLSALLANFREIPDDGSVAARFKKGAVNRIEQARSANDQRKAVELLELEMERERSRALLVSERQGRASGKGAGGIRQSRKALADHATAYLQSLDEQDADLRATIAETRLAISAAPLVDEQQLGELARTLRQMHANHLQGQHAATAKSSASAEPKVVDTPQRDGRPPAPKSDSVPVSAADIRRESPGAAQPTERPVANSTRQPSDERSEQIAMLAAYLRDYPEFVRPAATGAADKPRYELTETAPKSRRAEFAALADNPRLHFEIGKIVPVRSAAVPAPLAPDTPRNEVKGSETSRSGQDQGQQTTSELPPPVVEPALAPPPEPTRPPHELPADRLPERPQPSPAALPSAETPRSTDQADTGPNHKERASTPIPALSAHDRLWLLWLAGKGKGQKVVTLPPEWAALVQAASDHVDAEMLKEAIGTRPPRVGRSPQPASPAIAHATHQAAYDLWRRGGGGVGGT